MARQQLGPQDLLKVYPKKPPEVSKSSAGGDSTEKQPLEPKESIATGGQRTTETHQAAASCPPGSFSSARWKSSWASS